MTGIPTITPLDGIVGANIRRLRTEHKISQEQLAEVLGCSSGFVSLLETGKRAWSNKWIWDAIQYFKVDAVELFGGVIIAPEDKPILEAIKKSMDARAGIEKSSKTASSRRKK